MIAKITYRNTQTGVDVNEMFDCELSVIRVTFSNPILVVLFTARQLMALSLIGEKMYKEVFS